MFSLGSWLNHRKKQPHPNSSLSLRAFPLTLEGAAFGHDETISINTHLPLLGKLAWYNCRSCATLATVTHIK